MKNNDIELEIERAFRYFAEIDQNIIAGNKLEDMYIDIDKLTKVAEGLEDLNTSEYTLKQMIKVADKDGDGKVYVEDFKRIMRRMKLY